MNRYTDRGSVLVFTLWLLVCISLIALGFGRRARLEVRAAAYEMDKLTARYLAHSAAELGVAMLRKRILGAQQYDSMKDDWAKEQEVDISKLLGQDDARLSEGCTVSYIAVDEDRKVNINKADGAFLQRLRVIPRGLAGAVEVRRSGNDSIWGSGDDMPFTAPEEVLALQDVTEKDWFGDPNKKGLSLRDVITTYGSKFININTAPLEVVEAIPGLRKQLAKAIVSFRQGADGEDGTADDKPFESMEDLLSVPRMTSGDITNLQQYCRTHSSAFTVTGKASLHDGRVTATAEIVVIQWPTGMATAAWREG